ncbi:diacylglycerol/lipid kinase family protein [Lachnoclostridium phytofermentans]|uniref:Diacylglycerol kinase catalytic region n=1 Tax=Lachnoclostridium phytofermentans (strain ATCC 700394 / DSM 18823 / ISDg) TaxID=357809 RepID=A9KRY1_LACP7|nr:diacylglycerol kinase family protein [Lachnoclostridium phytofermentans]ABX40612.1 diacylglycerol kinase catalytic region [Lachnoclostridium phytofermentans ISDg]
MYHFIINPHSKTGKAKELWQGLRQRLENESINYKEYFTTGHGHATQIAKEICTIDNERKTIVIVGGDGTANEVINGIDNYEDVLLGYIPMGSSNDLARGLLLPKNPAEALDRVLNPRKIRAVDHGQVTFEDGLPRRFSVSSGIGYDAAICQVAQTTKIKNFLNKIGIGKLTYFLIGVKEIFANKPCDATVIADGITYSVKNLIFMASLIHKCEGGGLLMAPDASDNDRKLSICLVSNIPKLKILFVMPTIFLGKHTKIKGVQMITCSSVSIHTQSPLYVHTDGEVLGEHTDLTLRCTSEQVNIIT